MPNGVKIREIVIGTGASVGPKAVVMVHIRGFLNRGALFFDTAEFSTPLKIDLARREVVAGLRKGIVGMCVGGKREITVSPHLGYGEKGVPGKVPANAVLRFEVEVVGIRQRGVIYAEDFPHGKQIVVFRPGEAAKGKARWQFSATDKGNCGALITFPPVGTTWRYARTKSVPMAFSISEVQTLFESAERVMRSHPGEILSNDELWADASEKGNSITRSRKTDEACVSVAVYDFDGVHVHYALPESSPVLIEAEFYISIMRALGVHLEGRVV